MKKNLFLFTLVIISVFANSQDTLLLKNGSKILCEITNQDSTTVYFDIEKNDQTINTFIFKDKLEDIRYFDPAHVNNSFAKKSLEISVGLSIPMGDYGNDDDADNENSGYAGNGLNVNIVYGYHFTKNIGIAVKGNYVNNNFETYKFFNGISEYITSYTKNFYTLYGALAGPSVSLNPIKKISINSQFLVGYAILIEPVVSSTVNTGSEIFDISLDQVSASAVLYNVRMGIKYIINEKVDIIANMDYLHGSFDFGTVSLLYLNNITDDVFHSEELERGTQKYDVINLSIGVSLKF